jgi:hypothetical protein
MGYWSVVTPKAATNLVTNPSLEGVGGAGATTGYTAVGGSIATSSAQRKYGLRSLAVTPTAGTTDGVYYGTVSLTSGTTYTASCWVRGVLGVAYKIYFANTSGTLKGTATTFTGTGDWQRVEVSWACDSTTTYRIYITKNSHASTGVFYCDGLQCEADTAATTYIDGTQEGCEWTGTPHASTSTRDGQSRAGGSIINLSTYGVNVMAEMGIGAPGAQHWVQEQALLDGATFQGRRTLPRTIDLVCQLKGDNYAGLFSLRKDLWDALKPDLVRDDQPFWLAYSGANSAKDGLIRVVYDSGLELGNPEMWLEEFTVRFIAYDPNWYEWGNDAIALSTTQSVADADLIIRRIDGVWSALGSGMATSGTVYAIVKGINGEIYAVGYFTTAGGVTVNNVAKWSDGAWSALGATPGVDSYAYCAAVAPNGDLYVGGAFANAGGGAAANIAKWNGSTWSALGSGMNGNVLGLAFDQSGNLYAVGAFTTAGGTTVNRVAKWDGSTWSALGATPGVGAQANAVAISPDNEVYVGGQFTTAGGSAANYIAVWDGSAWSALGSEVNNYVYTLAFGPDGTLYAGGIFTTAGGITVGHIASWNGSAWKAMGSGTSGGANEVRWIKVSETGLVYLSGIFTEAGGITIADRIAVWNGSTYGHLPVNLPGSATVFSVLPDGDDLYLGFNSSGSAITEAATATTNSGTRQAYPVLKVYRSGGTTAVLETLENVTTRKRLWLNYALQSGELLTIDLRPGKRSVKSSMYGDVWRALLRNSDFSDFTLLPGSNSISAFVSTSGSPTVTAWMEWQTTHWGADGVAA